MVVDGGAVNEVSRQRWSSIVVLDGAYFSAG